jgi:hypothetical protein
MQGALYLLGPSPKRATLARSKEAAVKLQSWHGDTDAGRQDLVDKADGISSGALTDIVSDDHQASI